jgi:DNA repair and recombination protein RAD52
MKCNKLLTQRQALIQGWADFDEADFAVGDEDHPDEVSLPNPAHQTNSEKSHAQPINPGPVMQPPSKPPGRSSSGASTTSAGPYTPNQFPPRTGSVGLGQNYRPNGPRPPPNQSYQNQNHNQNQNQHQNHNQQRQGAGQHGTVNNVHQKGGQAPRPNGQSGAPAAESTGFFSARAVSQLSDDAFSGNSAPPPQAGQGFNLHTESPSIRKTPGIDHTKSKPLGRNGQHVKPEETGVSSGANTTGPNPQFSSGNATRPAPPATRGNTGNQQFDQVRKIGAPGGPGSPLSNRGQYRPLTMKRPAGAPDGATPSRSPLGNVSGNTHVAVAVGGASESPGGPDLKRLKTG